MPPTSRYPVPAGEFRQAEEISRSRFIATVAPAPTIEDAASLIARVREEFADATHNCWAYVVGPPGSTTHIGMSDDGEPHGTAGKPMLGMLLHGGTGDTVAVVTRYYGGTKLGTGGLVRAYGGCVQRALASMPRAERVERVALGIRADYASIAAIQAAALSAEAEISDQHFESDVRLVAHVPTENRERLVAAVLDITRGRATITQPDDDHAA